MTSLRQRMIEDLQLHGLSKKTQDAYVRAVRQLAEHYGKSPDRITEEELRQYFLYLKNVKHASRSACTIALCGIKFFCQYTLRREWAMFDLVRPPREKKLPVVLSSAEVRRILGCLRLQHYRVCLSTIYSCGLRVQEGVHLQVRDIDSDRMAVHVRHGKGAKDRYVPLPKCTLQMLRQYWCTHRHAIWLFPARTRAGVLPSTAAKPMSVSGVQKAFKAALQESEVQKPATVHTLRHSYATHLLEAGVSLRIIQAYLGHSSPPNHGDLHPRDPRSRRLGCGGYRSRDGKPAMTELAEVFCRYGPPYRAQYGDRMLPSHRQAMRDIEHCRTPALGGHVYECPDCGETHYLYHSCRNRHCPKCQNDKAQQWLAQQQALLLPVPYFLVTFTLPSELREVARSHQKLVYHLLFRISADAMQRLASDARFVGGQLGMIGVLHTWGRNLSYHPHVHYLVPGGGLAVDGIWCPSRKNFLLPVKALSRIFRAKFRDALHQNDPHCFADVPSKVWNEEWIVHSKPVGNGLEAVKYLAPYVFRVAISNNRILKLEHDKVTFRYRASDTGKLKTCVLPAEEFIRRFLQHVLPKGFVKVRYYGFFSPGLRRRLAALRYQLDDLSVDWPLVPRVLDTDAQTTDDPADVVASSAVVRCPSCGQVMRRGAIIPPQGRSPP